MKNTWTKTTRFSLRGTKIVALVVEVVMVIGVLVAVVVEIA